MPPCLSRSIPATPPRKAALVATEETGRVGIHVGGEVRTASLVQNRVVSDLYIHLCIRVNPPFALVVEFVYSETRARSLASWHTGREWVGEKQGTRVTHANTNTQQEQHHTTHHTTRTTPQTTARRTNTPTLQRPKVARRRCVPPPTPG